MRRGNIIYLILTGLAILTLTAIIILLASGYSFDLENRRLKATGIISVSSVPDGALVYINNVPKDATNTSVTKLDPGNYDLRIEKEGYSTWSKQVEVNAELVTEIEALLIPLNPSLKPLTYTGIKSPITSPDGEKIVYQVDQTGNQGIWMLNLNNNPFNLSQKAQILIEDTSTKKYSSAVLRWSPDSTSILIEAPTGNEVINVNSKNVTTVTNIEELTKDWKESEQTIEDAKLATLNENLQNYIKGLTTKIWSPDNELILYPEVKGQEINYFVLPVVGTVNLPSPAPTNPKAENLPDQPIYTINGKTPHMIKWFPDSQHLLIAQEVSPGQTKIEIMEIDGKNLTHIFTGQVKDLAVFPVINGSKVIALTTFNPGSPDFNLYEVNLR